MTSKDRDVIGLKCRIPRLRKRLGRCYELSYEGLCRDPDWTLVHGALKGAPELGGWVSHAWLLKESDQMIFDPAQDRLFAKYEYQLRHKPKVYAEYNLFEAMCFVAHFKHSGPWHDLASDEEFSKLIYEAVEAKRRYIEALATPDSESDWYGEIGKEGYLRIYGAEALEASERRRLRLDAPK